MIHLRDSRQCQLVALDVLVFLRRKPETLQRHTVFEDRDTTGSGGIVTGVLRLPRLLKLGLVLGSPLRGASRTSHHSTDPAAALPHLLPVRLSMHLLRQNRFQRVHRRRTLTGVRRIPAVEDEHVLSRDVLNRVRRRDRDLVSVDVERILPIRALHPRRRNVLDRPARRGISRLGNKPVRTVVQSEIRNQREHQLVRRHLRVRLPKQLCDRIITQPLTIPVLGPLEGMQPQLGDVPGNECHHSPKMRLLPPQLLR